MFIRPHGAGPSLQLGGGLVRQVQQLAAPRDDVIGVGPRAHLRAKIDAEDDDNAIWS